MGELVEGIDLDLFVEGGDCVIVFALLPICATEGVVGRFVVGIDLDLLFQSGDGVVVLAQSHVGDGQGVPGVFVLGLHFGVALEKLNRQRKIAAADGRPPAFKQIVGLHIGG